MMRLFFLPISLGIRINSFLRNNLEISKVELSIMNPCNLHCRDCKDLNTALSQCVDLEIHQLISDVDDFLGNVHHVHRLDIIGGEPLHHRDFNTFITHLIQQPKISLINIITPGSMIPAADVLRRLQHDKIMLTVSSFPADDAPEQEAFLAVLKEQNINFMKRNIWRDLGSFNPVANQDEVSLKNRYAQCLHKNYHNLSKGGYHLCPRSAHGRRLGQYGSEATDFVDFKNHRKPVLFRKELKSLLRKKYLAACRTCMGSRRETLVEKCFTKIEGDWYRQNIYYKYRIFTMPLWKQKWARLLLLPASVVVKLYDSISGHLEIPRVELPITTRCNFSCRDCANLISSYGRREDEDVQTLIQDVRDFLYNVGRVDRFIIMGGETFLYSNLSELIRFLIGQKKIKLIRLVTNGSMVPDAQILEQLKHKKIIVSVTNYPKSISSGKEHLVEIFQEHHINYFIEDNPWIDMGGFNPTVDNSPEALKRRFAECSRKHCHNISRGEYHLCPRSVHGERLGQFVPNESDKIKFRGMQDPKKFKAERHRLLKKDYLQACTKCKGVQGEVIMMGLQMIKEK